MATYDYDTVTSSEPWKDEDREELLRIWQGSEVSALMEARDAFFDALLHWKRGERFWCRHIPMNKDGVYEAQQHAGWPFIVEKVGDEVMFCPICGAKRP